MPDPESETVTSSRCGGSSSRDERHFAIARVAKGISRNLRSGGREANLILVIESKFRRHLAGALPCCERRRVR